MFLTGIDEQQQVSSLRRTGDRAIRLAGQALPSLQPALLNVEGKSACLQEVQNQANQALTLQEAIHAC